MYCGAKATPPGRFPGTPSACYKQGLKVGYGAGIQKGRLERGGTATTRPAQTRTTATAEVQTVALPRPVTVPVSTSEQAVLAQRGHSVVRNGDKWLIRIGRTTDRKTFGGRQDTQEEAWKIALQHYLATR